MPQYVTPTNVHLQTARLLLLRSDLSLLEVLDQVVPMTRLVAQMLSAVSPAPDLSRRNFSLKMASSTLATTKWETGN